MFEGFQAGADRQSRRRFAASGGISLALYALIAIGIIAVASRPREKKKPPPVKVVFKKPAKAAAAKPKPPPPAPPPRARKRTASRKASSGPAAAPTALPDGGLAEGDASDFRAGGVTAIDWESEAGGLGGALTSTRPAPPPPPPPKPKSANVGLPKGAIPPEPEADNRLPAYPDAMRKKGVEGLVVLRVLVGSDGAVSEVVVVSGQEPFLSAAIDVVRSWRYTPALVEGRPRAVHRIIRVPFRLRS
jgi:protein TonB